MFSQRDARRPLCPQYVLGMSATRLAIPLYLYGCPANLLRVQPDYAYCVLLVSYMAVSDAKWILKEVGIGEKLDKK